MVRKSLLIIGLFIAVVFLTPLAMAVACGGGGGNPPCVPIQDPNNGEDNLYKIFNNIFGTHFTSSNQLFDARGFTDSDDDWWMSLGGSKVEFTVKFAGYNQELGIIMKDDLSYKKIIGNIQSGYKDVSVPIIVPHPG